MKYYFECDNFRAADPEEERQIGFKGVRVHTGRTMFCVEAEDRQASFAAAKARADAEMPGHGELGLMASFDVYPRLLAQAMDAKGVTVRELGELTGVSTNIISGLRTGRREPQAKTLRRLADALGTTMDALWPSVGQ